MKKVGGFSKKNNRKNWRISRKVSWKKQEDYSKSTIEKPEHFFLASDY